MGGLPGLRVRVRRRKMRGWESANGDMGALRVVSVPVRVVVFTGMLMEVAHWGLCEGEGVSHLCGGRWQASPRWVKWAWCWHEVLHVALAATWANERCGHNEKTQPLPQWGPGQCGSTILTLLSPLPQVQMSHARGSVARAGPGLSSETGTSAAGGCLGLVGA